MGYSAFSGKMRNRAWCVEGAVLSKNAADLYQTLLSSWWMIWWDVDRAASRGSICPSELHLSATGPPRSRFSFQKRESKFFVVARRIFPKCPRFSNLQCIVVIY